MQASDCFETVSSAPRADALTSTGSAPASSQSVLYVHYGDLTVYPPLAHSAQILARDGWDVVRVGLREPHSTPAALAPRIRDRLLTLPQGRWRRKLQYGVFVLRVLIEWAKLRRCGATVWLYVSNPLTCPAAWPLLFGRGKVIYHEHDFPLGVRRTLFSSVMARARGAFLARADVVVVPQPTRARLLRREITKRPERLHVVMNCPLKSELTADSQSGAVHAEQTPKAGTSEETKGHLPHTNPRRGKAKTTQDDNELVRRGRASGGSANRPLALVYQGALSPTRLGRSLFAALASVPVPVCLDIVGYGTTGSPGYRAKLHAMVAEFGLVGRVQIRGPYPHNELYRLAARADLGISLFPTRPPDWNERTMPGASNKVFEYLAAGTAVLVPPGAMWKRIFVDTGFAIACDAEDVAQLRETFAWAFTHRDELAEMGKRGQAKVQTSWNYEHQFAAVLAVMNAGRASC